ncbi:cysteine hydrolase family protein [Balneatrix alpica]|uniref:cysteine hydrolase family protein n=1 Tax=Balneatrix alpica TaxID=75684 RepID=UPI0027386069|nr:cysteine hydrolase family protein [Balneatrix alpica]
MTRPALIVIDLQNDYFPTGHYPLHRSEEVRQHCQQAIELAQQQGWPVILVQHLADPAKGLAPFFNEGTEGAAIHPQIATAAAGAPVVIKRYADAFEQTELAAVLDKWEVDTLLLCGMMTQNCVTHTALSKAAEGYQIKVLGDCCTTVDEMLHRIALNALSSRVELTSLPQLAQA